MPKRAETAAAAPTASAKKQKGEAAIPLDEWRVVVTGDFTVKPKPALEAALKSKGVAVTGLLSGKTTHLILGKSGVNEYGKKTGVGSAKYNQALERGLPIVSENEVWGILAGKVETEQLAEKRASVKPPAKSAPLSDKVIFAVRDCGEAKLSLPRIKKELESRFDLSFDSTRSKNNLKKVLNTSVEKGKLEKDGASYKIPDAISSAAVASLEWTPQDDRAMEEDRSKKVERLCPAEGKWRGLRILSEKKSKSGRAKCKVCGLIIRKGEMQAELSDDSLFRMLVFPGDCHEGVSRGYVECGFPGYEVVSRKKFFVHGECKDRADDMCQKQFKRDWKKLRPFVRELASDSV